MLSTSGHIAALVNPPGNPKASYQVNKDNPADPQAVAAHGADPAGQLVARPALAWLGERCGAEKRPRRQARRRRPAAAGRGARHLRLRQLKGRDHVRGHRSLPGHGLLPDRRPAHRRGARLPAAHPRLRRRRGAAGHQRLLGARGVPLAADQGAGQARHRRRRHPGIRLPADEPDRHRAGAHGAQPRRRQPGHLPRCAGRAGDAVDRHARLRGAEAALAAADGARWRSWVRSRSPSRPTARTRSRWRPRPAATATTWVLNGAKKWIGNGTIADVVVRVGPRHRRQAGQGLPRREGHRPGTTPSASTARARCARCGRPRSP